MPQGHRQGAARKRRVFESTQEIGDDVRFTSARELEPRNGIDGPALIAEPRPPSSYRAI